MNLEDLIKYENENTTLDFKSIQYKKEQTEALIKDVMSMANTDLKDDKYIIIGVKHKPYGEKEIIGIEKTEFVDAATYQQIIYENIEPEIDIDYFSHEYEGKILGVIRISNCTEKPYIMKKDFKNLNKGDCYIRKGTQQMKMLRNDYIKIFSEKSKENTFKGLVNVVFDDNHSDQIYLKPIDIGESPSTRVTHEIKRILDRKKGGTKDKTGIFKVFNLSDSLFGKPYENRSIEELENNLLEVKETYREHDYYELYEDHSYKVNLKIINESNDYIEDASIQISIDKVHGILIASRYYEKPRSISSILSKTNLKPSFESINYPKVEQAVVNYIITEDIGDIRHHIPILAFKVPIRVVITKKVKGQLYLKCKLYGKNMPIPLEFELSICINQTESLLGSEDGKSSFDS